MSHTLTTTLLLLASTLLLLLSGGGTLPWTVWVGSLLLLLPVAGTPHRQTPQASHLPATLPFLLVTMYLLIMLLPVPLYLSLLGGIPRFQENEAVHDMIHAIRQHPLIDPPPASPWFALTRNRAGTLRILLYTLLCFAGYLAAFRARPHTRTILWTLAAIIAATAIAGILGRWVWPQGDSLWWYIRIAHGLPGPMAGFVNPNHYAGFLALGIAISGALLADALARRAPIPILLTALSLLLITGSGVLLSLSRGGLLASAAALGTITLCGFRHISRRARFGLLLPSLLLAAALVVTLAHNPTVRGRLAELRNPTQSASGQDRMLAWRDSLHIIVRYPILGAGPNAYRTTYPMHRTSSREQAYRTFAENEYIQLACDTGIVGILLATLTLLLLIRPLRQAIAPTPPTPRFPARLAACAALAAAAVHAGVEFVLHLPVYQLILIALIALATPDTAPHGSTTPGHHFKRLLPERLALPLALLLLIGLAHASFSTHMRRDRLGFISSLNPPELVRLLAWSPTEAHLWTRLGQRLPLTPASTKLRLACIEQAARYNPLSASLHIKLAQARLDAGDHPGAASAIQEAIRIRPWVPIPQDLKQQLTENDSP